jgi:hypothetical protein
VIGFKSHLNNYSIFIAVLTFAFIAVINDIISTPADMQIEINGCRVLLSLHEGQLSETYQVLTHDGWVQVLEYEGLLIRRVRPVEGIVLFDFESGNGGEWVISGLSSSVFTQSRRLDFGQHGDGFIGTGEDGKGGYDETMIGQLESRPVTLPYRYVSLLIGGGRKEEWTYVAVCDAKTGKELKKATGIGNHSLQTVEWDLEGYEDREVFFRIVDRDKGRWGGSINVDYIVAHKVSDSAVLPPEPVKWIRAEKSDNTLIIRGRAAGIDIVRKIRLTHIGVIISHQGAFNPRDERSLLRLNSYEDRYIFSPGIPDFVWSQSIKREATDYIPHWQFKSPAVIFQKDYILASIIADLNILDSGLLHRQPTALDLGNQDGEKPWFSYGIAPEKHTFHSIFGRYTRKEIEYRDSPLVIDHILLLSGVEEPGQGYRRVVSNLWEEYGKKGLLENPDLQTNWTNKVLGLFDSWRNEAWHCYAQDIYREFDYDGERCATFISRRKKAEDGITGMEDGWFNSWFQTLRTAYGMYIYGQRIANLKMMQQSKAVLNLVLHAPQKDGLFPTIYWRDKEGFHHWDRDNAWAGFKDYYHIFDMAWTAYWMLRWYSDLTPDEMRIIPFCQSFGDFLLSHMEPSGLIPAWYDNKLKPKKEFQTYNAEVAGAALFLAELYAVTGNNSYLNASEKMIAFVEQQVLPNHRWFDYETFISCSRKPFDFYDPYTRQFPQNNLCIFQATKACLRLYEITGTPHYLELGCQICDYMSLFQQVANHPLLSPKMIGGFTTQNTDAEWSDARQCYAAIIFLDYYEVTGRSEYLERGVAALRSTFAVAPYENWAHMGDIDKYGSMTGFHWGTGSAMASVEMVHLRYRDVYIHVGRQHGIGVNGCTLTDLTVTPHQVRCNLFSPYHWSIFPVAVIEGAHSPLTVIINGVTIGSFSTQELAKGIKLPFFQH